MKHDPRCTSWSLEDRISEEVERWHESDSDLPVHEWLGMTWEQYSLFVEEPPTQIRFMKCHEDCPVLAQGIARGRELAAKYGWDPALSASCAPDDASS